MKISGFENVISIEKFEYCNKVDEHEMCRFVCSVREKDVDSLLDLCDSDCHIEDDIFKFEGHITDISLSKDISGNRLEVNIVGKTYLYDEEKHNRIFQNPEKTISDILSSSGSMSDIKHRGKQDKVISEIIVQDNASDWEFIKYLANIVGEKVFSGADIFIAEEGSDSVELTEEDCIDFNFSIGRKESLLCCRINQDLSIGSIVGFNNKKFIIISKKYFLDKGQYYFEYIMCEKKETECDSVVQNGELLEAVVKDNNDPDKMGKVQVSFASDVMEDCMEDSAAWIEQESFYSTKGYGAIFIPAIDDKVLVRIKNGKAYVLGCLRTEAFNEAYQSQDNKYILIDDKVFIEYKLGCFAITNKDNTVSLSDKQASIKIGDKTQILIESGKASVQIDRTIIEITGDISGSAGKITVEAKNEASLSATSVNIKGKSGVSIN